MPEPTSDQPPTIPALPPECQALPELTEQQFQQWRHHPVSRMVLRFLADRSQALEVVAVQRLKAGTLDGPLQGELRGRMLELDDCAGIQLPAIREFYGVEGVERK